MKSFKAEILRELRIVAKNNKLLKKDIMEWSTGKVTAREGETLFYLPEMGVNVAVKTPLSS